MNVHSIDIDLLPYNRVMLRLVLAGALLALASTLSGPAAIDLPQAPGASTQAPNVFWCPMHPDVRSSTPGKCPICAMDLVRIPPRTPGNFQVRVSQVARKGRAGIRALHIEVRDPVGSAEVSSFSPLHERLFHLFIVSRDLSYFAHLHPEPAPKGFDVDVDLGPGVYTLISDFAPAGGAPQLVHRTIVTPGYRLSPFGSPDLRPDMEEKIVDGVRVSVESQPKLLKPSVLRFTLRDAVTGTPLTDLEPFLGAPGHLLIVNADLTTAIHAHPDSKDTQTSIGPDVVFAPTFGTAGVYKMWGQFQRAGKVFTASFAVNVQ
jgi:heavy metal-binding protein